MGCQCFRVALAYARYCKFLVFPTFLLPDKPTEPMNVTVQEIRSNNTECHVHNKLIWEPPVDNGDTPITSYLVEYKHPVFNRILISETVSGSREHVICKLQASGYPREVHVDVRAINKVGRGFRSLVVPVSFFSEFVCLFVVFFFLGFRRLFKLLTGKCRKCLFNCLFISGCCDGNQSIRPLSGSKRGKS